MKRGRFVIAIVLGSVACRPPPAPLPVIATVPDFALIDQDARPISLADLRGSVWVADFIFTHCAGPCPLMSARMSDLQNDVANLPRARLVSFSVDPTRDTPPVLREYAARYHARGDLWKFVTGGEKKIHDLAIQGFKLTVEPETQSSPLMHSTMFMLVDRQARIRGAFNGDDREALQRLRNALRSLANE